MPSRSRIGLKLFLVLAAAAATKTVADPEAFPTTPRRPVNDTYHGREVVEDYRWLEDWSDPAVRAWSEAENTAARARLDAVPARAEIARRLEALTRPIAPKYYGLAYRGGVCFALKDEPPKQQPTLICFRSPADLADERVIVDPEAIDPTAATAIDFFVPSLDGRLVAVSLSQKGSESGTVLVFETATGRRLSDEVPGVNGGTAGGSVAWNADATGFLRTRYPQPGERPDADLAFYEQVYFHALGTDAETDLYVFGKELPRIAEIFLESSDDGRFVLADVLNGDGGEHAFWLRESGGPFRRIADFADGFVEGRLAPDALFLLERRRSPNGRIVRLPLSEPDLSRVVEVVAESDAAIEGFAATPGMLLVTDVLGGPSRVRLFDHAGRAKGVLPLPELVSAGPVLRLEGDAVLVRTESYTTPPAWWRYDPGDGRLAPTALRMQSPADLSGIEVRREFATSKDGTRVPMTVLLRRGLETSPETPALLTGYGGFGISLSPSFDETSLLWLEQGCVYAIANLRGGGEYGESWHQAGCLARKQNVVDDFAACAHRLVDAGYTSPGRLAIRGGSNGGLLMGAALTQHPGLFRAVVSSAGIYDMLRNELTPNGSFNTTEYGSVADAEQFAALVSYSPYHHVTDGAAYPAVLFLTGENDPRVDPFHSRKMTARLQAASASSHPVLLRTSSTTGHGQGTPYSEEIEQQTDIWAFLFSELGIEYRSASD